MKDFGIFVGMVWMLGVLASLSNISAKLSRIIELLEAPPPEAKG